MNFTLTFTQDELNYLGSVLQERPFKEVAGFLGKINQQIATQQVKPAPVLDPSKEILPPTPELQVT